MPAGSYDPLTIAFGVLGRPHGLRGEVSLRPFNAAASLPAVPLSVTLERPAGPEARVVVSARRAHAELLVCFEGIASREEAAGLTGAVVRLRRELLPPLRPGEYYIGDVVGCRVEDEHGSVLGEAEGVFWNGAQDVMVVKGDRERLIPLVAEYVLEVNGPGRLVRVRWSDVEEEVGEQDESSGAGRRGGAGAGPERGGKR